VEDDSAIARLLERYLVRAKFDVIVASSGAEALQLAAERTPDAITLDLLLPGISGLDVLRGLRDNERTRHIPVIIISIHGDEAGLPTPHVFARLTKPLNRDLLVRTVAAACTGSSRA
jgi:DNA-binding response OmpR family regulator